MSNCKIVNIANAITSLRIIGAITLIHIVPRTMPFYIIYILSGLTDMIDGTIARKTNSSSKVGAILDTIADFIFLVVCIIKFIIILEIPTFIYIWIGIIFGVKIIGYFSCCIKNKKVINNHTIMNKITGMLLFILPLTLGVMDILYSSIIVCTVATLSAITDFLPLAQNKQPLV